MEQGPQDSGTGDRNHDDSGTNYVSIEIPDTAHQISQGPLRSFLWIQDIYAMFDDWFFGYLQMLLFLSVYFCWPNCIVEIDACSRMSVFAWFRDFPSSFTWFKVSSIFFLFAVYANILPF